MVTRFVRGAGYVLRGGRFLISHPRLWPWVLTPYAITLVLFVLAAWVALGYWQDVIDYLTGWVPGFLAGILDTLLTLLAILTLGLASYFIFFAVAAVIAGPFNEFLAEAVEELSTGRPSPPFSFWRFTRDVLLTIAHELRKILRYLLLIALLFVLSWLIPGIGWVIYAIGGAWLTARFAAYDVLDYTMARRGWSFQEKKAYLARHRSVTTGLGAGVALWMLIPLAGPLAYSFGSVGGTLLFLELEAGKE